jgi:hypothetical protein
MLGSCLLNGKKYHVYSHVRGYAFICRFFNGAFSGECNTRLSPEADELKLEHPLV